MNGKLVAITGANDGIGFATAKELLRRDFSLVMFCRNIPKAEKARKDLVQETGNFRIEIIQVELSSFKSIDNACSSFLKKYDKLDVLINNAGIMQTSYKLSEDGIEMTMAVNHFATFLMTFFLMPALKKANEARVVNLASRAHFDVRIDLDKINKKDHFNFRKQYKCSKLANVLFTRKLAQLLEETSITCNCLDPGLVKTSIGEKAGSTLFSWVWRLFTLRGVSPAKGAETVVYLASSKKVKNINGQYFEECSACGVSTAAKEDNQMNDLWAWTVDKTGLEGCKF